MKYLYSKLPQNLVVDRATNDKVGSMRSCHITMLILFNVGCKTSSRNNVLDLLHSTVTRVII